MVENIQAAQKAARSVPSQTVAHQTSSTGTSKMSKLQALAERRPAPSVSPAPNSAPTPAPPSIEDATHTEEQLLDLDILKATAEFNSFLSKAASGKAYTSEELPAFWGVRPFLFSS